MKKFLRIIWIIIVLAWAFLVMLKTTTRFTPAQPTTTLANPASVYCEQQSGTLEIVTDASGAQSGICHLVDGTTCDEWAYFRGECGTKSGEVVVADEISYPLLDYIRVEKQTFNVKKQITVDRIYGDRCDNTVSLTGAEKLAAQISDADMWTIYKFINTKYENSWEEYANHYTITIIPNVFHYTSKQEIERDRSPYVCAVGAFGVSKFNDKYLLLDQYPCGVYQASHLEGCEEIVKNVISKIQLN